MTIERKFETRPKTRLATREWAIVVENDRAEMIHRGHRGRIAWELNLNDLEQLQELLQSARNELQLHAQYQVSAEMAEGLAVPR